MSDFLPPVVARLIADSAEFTAAMGEADAKLKGFDAAQSKMAGAGKVAMLALGAAAAGVAVESVKLAMNFDQSMELIHTQAGAAQSEVDGLKDKVLALAPATGIGPEKLAEGLYHIESTGFRGQAALDILTAAAKESAMGLADLDTVTFALSGTMSVGMKDIKDAADATNYLNTIVGMGDMKMDKLAAAIGTGVLPSFKSAGLGMTDFGAALATISDNSVGADEAATRLRMTVSMMAAPTEKAAGALSTIGISSTQLADDMRKPDGLLVAIDDLKTHLEKSGKTASEQNAIISQAFGGGRSSSAILTLMEESDRLKSKYEGLGTSASRAKTADEAWAQQQKQFSQQMKQVGAEFQAIGVKIGEFLIPYIQKSAEWLTKHTNAVKIAALAIGGILVAAMLSFTASVIANTIAMLADPATWIFLAIVAAVALLAIGIYELYKHWDTVWGFIKRISLDVWHALVVAWNWMWHGIMAAIGWIKKEIIDPIVRYFDDGVKFVKGALHVLSVEWQFVWGFISKIIGDFVHFLQGRWNMIKLIFDVLLDNVLKPFWNWLYDVAIHPTIQLLDLLAHWFEVWKKRTGDALSDAWDILKKVFNWIKDVAINPTIELINKFKDQWVKGWHDAGDAVKWVWDHTMGPTIDLVKGAISTVQKLWDTISKSPSKAGGQLAGLLGFDKGGWVPGGPGEPQLAMVHGGEFVLSRDMIASGQGGPVNGPSMAAVSAGATRGGGAVTVVSKLYMDGRELHGALIKPAQDYKLRTGVTGLA